MVRPYNMMLGFPNRVDLAEVKGGSWLPALPITNIQTRLRSRLARSTDATPASTQFVLDLGQSRKVRTLALKGHNATLSGRVRYVFSALPDFSHIAFDTGWAPIWSSLTNVDWNIDELEWEDDNYWLGTYSKEEIEGFTATSVTILPRDVVARFCRVEVSDPKNPSGHLDLQRFHISPALQPRLNRGFGGGLGYQTKTTVEESYGGDEFFQVREPLRVLTFQLAMIRTPEAYGTWLELQRRAGVHSEILTIPNPHDPRQGLRQNFVGRLEELSILEEATWANGDVAHSMTFKLKEMP